METILEEKTVFLRDLIEDRNWNFEIKRDTVEELKKQGLDIKYYKHKYITTGDEYHETENEEVVIEDNDTMISITTAGESLRVIVIGEKHADRLFQRFVNEDEIKELLDTWIATEWGDDWIVNSELI